MATAAKSNWPAQQAKPSHGPARVGARMRSDPHEIRLGIFGVHPLTLEGSLRAWEGVTGVRVVEVWRTNDEVLAAMSQGSSAQIVLVPANLWAEVGGALASRSPGSPMGRPAVVVIGPDDAEDCRRAFHLDADAYVPLSSGFEALVVVVRAVGDGYLVYPRHLLGSPMTVTDEAWWEAFEAGHSGVLSKRQLEVALLVALGLSDREIASRLNLSPRTVEGLVSGGLAKLRVESRLQLALLVRSGGRPVPPTGPRPLPHQE